jgi:hypothetical protein
MPTKLKQKQVLFVHWKQTSLKKKVALKIYRRDDSEQ